MKTKRSVELPGSSRWSSIERLTIERLDRDVGMARIERVPMRAEYIIEFSAALIDTGVEVGMDQLFHWDVDRAQIRRILIEDLVAELGLRRSEIEALSENMVFWVLGTVAEEPRRVIHATRAAREIAKGLYQEVARREERGS